EAKQPEPKPDAPAGGPDVAPAADAHTEAAEEFDLSSLPKLDELTGSTDITAFLRKGVPEHLRNAALRKSWALDPAIRNYVNPALEYAYDWNTPGGVPGSSEIGTSTDVARLVSQILDTRETVVEHSVSAAGPGNEPAEGAAKSPEHRATPESEADLPTRPVRLGSETILIEQKPAKTEEGGGIEAELEGEAEEHSQAGET